MHDKSNLIDCMSNITGLISILADKESGIW